MKKLLITLTLAAAAFIPALAGPGKGPFTWGPLDSASHASDTVPVWDSIAGVWRNFTRIWSYPSARYGKANIAKEAFVLGYPSWLNDGPLYDERVWGATTAYFERLNYGQLMNGNGNMYNYSFTDWAPVVVPCWMPDFDTGPFYFWPGGATVRP